jgi:thioredoxin 1
MSIPTVILFKDGEAVETMVGLRPKEAYLEVIENHK